ncbi:MAG: acyl carrier protein [Paludibacteraceae bacterium]|nr:acyl carrier protein [Paludibacteraceae bacterium]
MNREEIIDRLTDIFQDVLDRDDISLTDQTTAQDIEEWDSLSHVQLIVAIERQFGIRFTSREIMMWQNVGQMTDSLMQKLN